MRYLRGDLSAPVLAILVTIGIIAAGLILLAWFWWFAPHAGRVGAIQVLGMPAIDIRTYNLTISIRNTGSADIRISDIRVEGKSCSIKEGKTALGPGESTFIVAECPRDVIGTKQSVSGVIITDQGTYTFTAAVIT